MSGFYAASLLEAGERCFSEVPHSRDFQGFRLQGFAQGMLFAGLEFLGLLYYLGQFSQEYILGPGGFRVSESLG